MQKDELQTAREYTRQNLPALLALSARLLKKASEAERESYAAAIAEEAIAAKTINAVIRAFAIDDEPAMRFFAAQLLQHCPPDEDLLLGLAQWLATDGDQTVAEAGFKVLGRWFQPQNHIYELVMDMLRSEFVRSRQAAVRILANAISDTEARQILLQTLKDKFWLVRQSTVEALGQTGDVKVVAVLLEALKDENARVQHSVILALGKIGDARVVEPLLEALKDESSVVRRSASQALARLNDKRAVAPLYEALKDGDESVQLSAAKALGQLGEKAQAIEVLLATLKDKNKPWWVRQNAAVALQELGDVHALEIFFEALKHEDWEVWLRAAKALRRLNDKTKIMDVLFNAQKDDNWKVRQNAALVLGQLDDILAVTALRKALKDKDITVRQTVIRELGRLEDIQVLDSLLEALKDENWYIRQSAAWALGQLGDVRAIETLITMLNDKDQIVRQSAAEALGQLGRGDVQLFSKLQELGTAENADLRYAAFLAIKPLIAISPQESFLAAERNLHNSEIVWEQRTLFLEIIGRCAFLGVHDASEVIKAWGQSPKLTDRMAVAALLGELLSLNPQESLAKFNQLADDEDWTIREAVTMRLAHRTFFCVDAAVKILRTLREDEEIAVAFSASSALMELTGEHAIAEHRRLRRYTRSPLWAQFFDRLLHDIQMQRRGGFALFPPLKIFFHPLMIQDLFMEPESIAEEDDRLHSSKSEKELAPPRPRKTSREELYRLLEKVRFEFLGPSGPQLVDAIEQLLQQLPEPLIFYVFYKQAFDDNSRSACRLFYEIASLIEKAESAEISSRVIPN